MPKTLRTPVTFLDGRVELWLGDCIATMAGMPANSVDSVVTDPPYHLVPSGNATGEVGHPSWNGATKADRSGRKAGFMGKAWDGGDIAFRPETWAHMLRVLKPGGHLVAFGAPRNYHRLACAIEDAGFEVRDCLMWIFGTGFPKSHNVAVAIDKLGGVPARGKAFNMKGRGERAEELDGNGRQFPPPYEAATAEAAAWAGWGTSLKPAYEPIILARKPLQGTVAANVQRWGTGAINIAGCRVPAADGVPRFTRKRQAARNCYGDGLHGSARTGEMDTTTGRWPANVLHDGSEEVLAGFPETGAATRGIRDPNGSMGYHGGARGLPGVVSGHEDTGGTAARFFYCAKASRAERAGSRHPTVKPIALIRYLCRLITPPGGVILDPFAGTGTTGAAALAEGFTAILCEREAEYVADIKRRLRSPALAKAA